MMVVRHRGCGSGRSGARRESGPPAAHHREGGRAAGRSLRPAQLLADRDPQVRNPRPLPAETLEEAARVARQPLGDDREDLRDLPIVAIDPVDARDHDDAVWAAPDDDPANPEGWRAIVAIADVSFYVRPGSAIDKDARRRGNSVYFPDRVVPMLPEILSADVCSLKEGEGPRRAGLSPSDHQGRQAQGVPLHPRGRAAGGEHRLRGCAGRHRWRVVASADRDGTTAALELLGRARQGARRSRTARPGPARAARGAGPEWPHPVGRAARAAGCAPADRGLHDRRQRRRRQGAGGEEGPVMYRVHEVPSRTKLVALKEYLETFDIPFAMGQVIRPATFNRIVDKVGDADFRPQVMEQILRSQTQAYYAPVNQGHFGLSLGSYAHFTSPIRRYADLVVHRALVGAYKLGDGGLLPEGDEMERLGTSISQMERRAMEAERETIDRYVAAYLSEHVGQVVETRITGVTQFRLFRDRRWRGW
ncbi:hypothetical protein LUZ63_021675 [Rhynchospora breviuscula]|uniref:RNB domain-containing protein n=1 Tax=Rhynchospora breviuscula TaxID=2022672 RepID=A0A9P9Z6B4_9POAL|nr:hypothetical protein LUZ63_021675 [Rhynchospora breviuscula]